jgi:hypothetical protein
MGSQVTLNGVQYTLPNSGVDPTLVPADLQDLINFIWAHFNQHHDYTGEQYDRDSINQGASLVRTLKVLRKLEVV